MVMTQTAEHIDESNAIPTIYESLVYWGTKQPGATFIVEAESGQQMTYGHALAAVNMLMKFLGTRKHTLLLALPGGMVNAVLWISALSGGHQLVPLSPQASDEEKARLAAEYKPDIVFVEERCDIAKYRYFQATAITKEMCERWIKRAPSLYLQPEMTQEGRVCLSTSGTTGDPKGVELNERRVAWTADHVRSSHQLSSHDRGLTVLPFFHVNAPVVSLFASLLAGSTVIIARRFSRRNFWLWVERYDVTWVSIVPTIAAMLLETEKPAFLPGNLRFMRTGSAPLPAHVMRAFEQRFGILLIETYGLSEAASQVTANPLPPKQHKAGSAGVPVGTLLRICRPRTTDGNDDLVDVPVGETGEICVSGPSIIAGYRRQVGQDAFQDGWFRTGDLGYLDSDGYIFITGRSREVIIRGGENIAPREIEEALLSNPAVREAAAVGRPDNIYGEQVVAYVSVRGTWNEQMASDLRAYAAQRLSSHKVPVEIIALSTLPKNATGKIERRLLRAREQARIDGQHVVIAPQVAR
jgi:acyl-CoA synthetase (AMP-forming)/AMP-acid ligase II